MLRNPTYWGLRLWSDSMPNEGRGGSLAKTWRAQSGDGKLASLAKGSPCGIYLLGTVLGKPAHPEIESNQIPRCQEVLKTIFFLRRYRTPAWYKKSVDELSPTAAK